MNLELILNFLVLRGDPEGNQDVPNKGLECHCESCCTLKDEEQKDKWEGGTVGEVICGLRLLCVQLPTKSVRISQSSSSVFVVIEGPQVVVYAAAPGTASFGLEVDVSF